MTSTQFTKTVSTIHLALLGGMLLFGIAIYFQGNKWIIGIPETESPFFYLVPASILGGVLLSRTLFQAQLKKLNHRTNLKEKLTAYQSALILSYALLEGPALLGIVISMLTDHLFYLILSGLMVVYFSFQRPTKQKIEEQLNLSPDLKQQWDTSDQLMS